LGGKEEKGGTGSSKPNQLQVKSGEACRSPFGGRKGKRKDPPAILRDRGGGKKTLVRGGVEKVLRGIPKMQEENKVAGKKPLKGCRMIKKREKGRQKRGIPQEFLPSNQREPASKKVGGVRGHETPKGPSRME